jgi:hypothetical protein
VEWAEVIRIAFVALFAASGFGCGSRFRTSASSVLRRIQHAGATLKEAQAHLGHANSTALEIYTISIPAEQRKAVENLSDLVTNGDELAQLGENLPLASERIQ